jgi:hypothetical protein
MPDEPTLTKAWTFGNHIVWADRVVLASTLTLRSGALGIPP